MAATRRPVDMPHATMATLMLAVFTESVGFGVLLPLLPYLIERLLGAGVEAAQVSWHTGLLTAVYTLSLFLFAPMSKGVSVEKARWLVPKLLILTFIVSSGVGVFEAGLALRGKQELGLTPYQTR